jgi:hypothetical protein
MAPQIELQRIPEPADETDVLREQLEYLIEHAPGIGSAAAPSASVTSGCVPPCWKSLRSRRTGPINYLVLIENIDLLPVLSERAILPSVVASELLDPDAPPSQRRSKLAAWNIRTTPTLQFASVYGLNSRMATKDQSSVPRKRGSRAARGE